MTIDWQVFTPASALVGGALIGAAAVVFIHVNGRIAGISGIVGGMLRRQRGDKGWRVAFVAGLVAAPLLLRLLSTLPPIRIEATYPLLALAGLLVGFGTRLGSGCTAGHGVCGLSRLSPRSLAATLTFMSAGFLTVFVVRHLIGG
jgi:uncharacterized membrane protein YedE/YeeE